VKPKSFAAFLGKSDLSRLNLLSCCNSATNLKARLTLAIDKKATAAATCWINKQNYESKSPAHGAGLARKIPVRARITSRRVRPPSCCLRIPAARAWATAMANEPVREAATEKVKPRPEEPTAERPAAEPGVPEDGAPAWPLPAWAEPEAWEPWAAAVPGLV
jgi:hypothetical protein